MEKKYKHRTAGFTATLIQGSEDNPHVYQLNTKGYGMFIPKSIVENSNDWELMEDKPKFVLVTEDGTVTDPMDYVYVVYNDACNNYHTDTMRAEDYVNANKSCWDFSQRAFISRTLANAFIEKQNDPKFEFRTEEGRKILQEDAKLYTLSTVTWLETDRTSAGMAKRIQESCSSNLKFFRDLSELEYYRKKFQPKPVVILTTQDGIDITDRDYTLHALNKNSWNAWGVYAWGAVNYKDQPYLVFSSEAKRDEYILANKPLLSLSEVSSLVNKISYSYSQKYGKDKVIADLISLAKSKM